MRLSNIFIKLQVLDATMKTQEGSMQNQDNHATHGINSLLKNKRPSDFAGQQLFIQGDDWQNNAMLAWTHFPWDIYAAGYKDAADALVEVLVNRKAPLDSVIYPLVFLYRQGLELELKLILPLARHLAGKHVASDYRHGLMPLWQELKLILQELDPREDDPELSAIGDFIGQLDTWIQVLQPFAIR